MHTKKIDIYLYTVYTWPLTTDTKKDTETCGVTPVSTGAPEPKAETLKQVRKVKSAHQIWPLDDVLKHNRVSKSKRTDPDAWRSCPSGNDLYRQSMCGERLDGTKTSTSVCRGPAARGMLCFCKPEAGVQYDGYIVPSSRSVATKATCRRGCGSRQAGQKVSF